MGNILDDHNDDDDDDDDEGGKVICISSFKEIRQHCREKQKLQKIQRFIAKDHQQTVY